MSASDENVQLADAADTLITDFGIEADHPLHPQFLLFAALLLEVRELRLTVGSALADLQVHL